LRFGGGVDKLDIPGKMELADLKFLTYYTRHVRYWWCLAFMAILGGGLGWAYSFFQVPQYDAKTSLIVTVDYSQTGNLSAYNVDRAVGTLQKYLLSADILTKVSSQILGELSPEAQKELNKQFAIERLGDTWNLRFRNTDRKVAADMVNIWLETGYQALIQARQHAITAQILQRYLYAMYSCPPPPVIGFAVPPVCQDTNALDPLALSVVNEQIQQELALSHAIQPYLIISKNSPAEIPDKPVQYDRKWFVLGGMLSFFCLAVGSLPLLQIRRQTRHETHP
jgi:uncharacterized protein involved in exopolysaccharide biosynthesis